MGPLTTSTNSEWGDIDYDAPSPSTPEWEPTPSESVRYISKETGRWDLRGVAVVQRPNTMQVRYIWAWQWVDLW